MDKLLKHHLKFVLKRYMNNKDTYVYTDKDWLYVADRYSWVRIPSDHSPFSENGYLINENARNISTEKTMVFIPPYETSQMTELEDTGIRRVLDNGAKVKVLQSGDETVWLSKAILKPLVPKGVPVKYWQYRVGPCNAVYLTFWNDVDVRALIAPVRKQD